MVVTDVDGLPGHLAEILDDDASRFSVATGEHANTAVNHDIRAAISVPNFCASVNHSFPLRNH